MAAKTLYIIDGFSQIFRAYYAPAAFRNRGQAAGATFIFTRMLLKLIQKGKPDAIVCALDSAGEGGIRAAMFPAYKAHRDPMPADLVEQIPVIREVIEGLGIPAIEGGIYEADDVIGALAKRAEDEGGWQVRIVSRDKDLKQLLSDQVFLYDADDGSLFGPDELEIDLGLKPSQFVDFLALMGDTSDGIPGAVGIGPKKAQALIQEYGSLEALLERAGEIKQPKMRESVENFRAQAPMSKDLARIRTEMPLEVELGGLKYAGPVKEKLLPVLMRMGFSSIIADLGWSDGATTGQAGAATAGRKVEPPKAKPEAGLASVTAGKAGAAAAKPGAARGSRSKAKAPAGGGMFDGPEAGEIPAAIPAKPTKGKGKQSSQGMFGDGPESEDEVQTEELEESDAPVGLADFGFDEKRSFGAKGSDNARGEYTLVNTAEGLKAFAKLLARQKRFAFDTETTSLDTAEANLVGMSFSWEPGTGYYVAVRGPKGASVCGLEQAISAVRGPLEDDSVGKVGQNLKYDMLVMLRHGVAVRGVEFDTMIGAYLADNTRQQVSLDQLALLYLGYQTIPITALIGQDKKTQITMDRVPLERICEYAAEDADIALRLAGKIGPELEKLDLTRLSAGLEMPLVEVLTHMEHVGIRVDVPYLKELAVDFEKRIHAAEAACHQAAGEVFTIGSPKQLGEILFDKLGLTPKTKTSKGARSTNQETLEALAPLHELPRMVLEYRHLSKLKSTYIDALPLLADSEDRVHTSFRQAVATGRIASNDPNVQNIPVRSEEGRKIRRAFIARDGWKLVVADYSQIELRILAHLSQDPTMVAAFAAGKDIHRAVAAEVNQCKESEVDPEMRARVKAIHFGILYGQSAFRLSETLGITRQEAQDFIDGYFRKFPRVQAYIGKAHEDVTRDGFVTTIMGRRRHIEGAQDRNRARQSAALRQAFNTVVQGSAADLIKAAMVRIHRKILAEKLPWRMLIQVHDELVFEAPDKHVDAAKRFAETEMAAAMTLDVPLVVDAGVGVNWLDAKH